MRVCFLLLIFLSQYAFSDVVELNLEIDYGEIAYGGEAMLVNGQYPAPTLYFKEGDTAKITVTNKMNVDTSIHWHGLLVPPEQDGVPYLSNFPIAPHSEFVYEFKLKHSGTYWYHSHTDLQEQSGVHGAIVIEPRKIKYKPDYEAVLVLQDWTKENPHQVLRNLKKDGDYYALKKDSVISLWGYWKQDALKNWLDARWMRMGGMDFSDVAYDHFLINGQKEQTILPNVKEGDVVRLRVVNSGASTYFHLDKAQELKWKVISLDGVDIKPTNVSELLHAPAETYDFLITIPSSGSFELLLRMAQVMQAFLLGKEKGLR